MDTVRPLARLLVTGSLVALVVSACAVSAATPTWTFPAGDPPPPAMAPMGASTAMDPSMNMGTTEEAAAPTAPAAAPANAPSGQAQVTGLDLTVVTGDMTGHTEFPAFIPSDFTLPANSTVVVTVTNFDDATALPKGSEQYATVAGTVGGTMAVTPIDPKSPNGSAGPSKTMTALKPTDVSHTFTIVALGINAPIAAHSRVTFTIHTGAPGTYAWRCYDPCGAGTKGWGTAMAAMSGFMEGTLTVA